MSEDKLREEVIDAVFTGKDVESSLRKMKHMLGDKDKFIETINKAHDVDFGDGKPAKLTVLEASIMMALAHGNYENMKKLMDNGSDPTVTTSDKSHKEHLETIAEKYPDKKEDTKKVLKMLQDKEDEYDNMKNRVGGYYYSYPSYYYGSYGWPYYFSRVHPGVYGYSSYPYSYGYGSYYYPYSYGYGSYYW